MKQDATESVAQGTTEPACIPGPPPPTAPCEHCKKLDHEVNHPTGMIFVGWGHGWQPCPHCGGAGVVPVLVAGEGRCAE